MPPPPTLNAAQVAHTLYFRVLAAGADALRVELWGHGELHGAMRITGVGGTSQLRARRVALAAAALARRLRGRRLADARRAAQLAAGTAEQPRQTRALEGRMAFTAGALGALAGPGDLALVGPGLGASVRLASGPRLTLGGLWAVGTSPRAADAGARWAEISVTPSVAVGLGPRLALDLGATLAGAAVHLSGVRAVDDVAGLGDTWSGRVALRPGLEARVGGEARLFIAPEAGVVLRRIVLEDRDGRRERLGGAWLGLGVGVVLDPHRVGP